MNLGDEVTVQLNGSSVTYFAKVAKIVEADETNESGVYLQLISSTDGLSLPTKYRYRTIRPSEYKIIE